MRTTDSPALHRAAAGVLALALAVGTCAYVIAVANAHTPTSAFEPLNGSFQTFQPVRRVLEGQWPGRDFVVYLGLGPTYVVAAATKALGGTFHDSLVATHVLAGLVHAFVILALARWSGRSWVTSCALVALGSVLILTPGAWLPLDAARALTDAQSSIARPGNSLLGLRSAAPLVALGMLGAWQAWRSRRHARAALDDARARPVRLDALVTGFAAGLVLPWSNDYGLVTAAALVAVESWFAPGESLRGRAAWRARVVFALIATGVTAIVGLAVLALATGGGVGAWYADSVAGVARDQRWFFFHGPRGSAWQPLGWFPYALGAVASVVVLLVAYRTRRAGDRAIATIVMACFGAAVISARASAETRYFIPLFRVLWILAPVAAWRALDAWRARSRAGAADPGTPRVARGVALAVGFLALGIGWRTAAREADSGRPAPQDVVACPEAGAPLPAVMQKVAWLARSVRAEADERHLPADARVFSTYSTMFDLLAGARQPTGADYVIHALGPDARARYLDTLRRTAPPYATTIRDDHSGFEGWIRKIAWPIYAELIENYDPFDRLPYAVVWKRRATPRAPSDVPVTVTWAPQDERGRLRLEVSIDAAYEARGEQIVEVEVTSAEGLLPDARPPPLGTNFVVGIDLRTPSVGGRFGIDPTTRRLVFPLEVAPGKPTIARLVPLEGGRISIESVRARTVLAKLDLDAFPLERLLPADRTDGEFERGVLRSGPAAFVVVDAGDLVGLAPGARLAFAASGEREVVAISGEIVTVDGPPLSPDDGYPSVARVVRR